jgi:hypothetical protein
MKNLQNQAAKLVPLKDLATRASKDKDFFNSLLKAPKTTLKNNALKLSEADGKKLSTLVTKARKEKWSSPKGAGSQSPDWSW